MDSFKFVVVVDDDVDDDDDSKDVIGNTSLKEDILLDDNKEDLEKDFDVVKDRTFLLWEVLAIDDDDV